VPPTPAPAECKDWCTKKEADWKPCLGCSWPVGECKDWCTPVEATWIPCLGCYPTMQLLHAQEIKGVESEMADEHCSDSCYSMAETHWATKCPLGVSEEVRDGKCSGCPECTGDYPGIQCILAYARGELTVDEGLAEDFLTAQDALVSALGGTSPYDAVEAHSICNREWCDSHAAAWEKKCTWETTCKDCSECASTCPQWCTDHTLGWELKLTWEGCKPCKP
jgi:hypothetical protein